jgi:hypothetical protein
METTHYFSYLMRIWQGDELPDGTWLASLEDPSTKQLIYFKSIEELFEFLKDRPDVDESQASNNQNDHTGQ